MFRSGSSPAYDQIRRIVEVVSSGSIESGEIAVLQSSLRHISGEDAGALLDDFFDVEPLTLGLFEVFMERGADWSAAVTWKLEKALVFGGFDEQAELVRAKSR